MSRYFLRVLATDAVETVSDFVRTAPYFVIALGSFILIISICGSVGAKWGKIWLLRVSRVAIFVFLFYVLQPPF